MSERLIWERDGRDWPNRQASRFVEAAGLRWHVQQMGRGPTLLLIHGTGAATHSWRTLMPLLAERFSVIAPDLPGHGFTDTPSPQRLSLPAMARSLNSLLRAIDVKPELVLGHSAGAAILARMALDGLIGPHLLISLNGALLPLHGLPGHLFAPAAKLLASLPLVPQLFARRGADRSAVERLIRSTGSRLDERGIELYARLVGNSQHIAGVLAMMANWDLRPLAHDLPYLNVPLILLAGANDRTIAPREARRVQALLPAARVQHWPDVGHLAHEEQPGAMAGWIIELAESAGIVEKNS